MSRLIVAWGLLWIVAPRFCAAVETEPVVETESVVEAETVAEAAPVDRRAATEFFEKKIRPLLIQRCDECHSAKKSEESGQLALDSRARLMAGGTRGPVVVASQPDASLLIKAIRYVDPKLQMPPEGKLPDAEIELLTQWIRDGAFVPEYGQDAGRKSQEIDWDAARQFWSFRPLVRPAVPFDAAVPFNASAARSPVDSLIINQHREHGVTSAPTADRRTLIRRLSFDLWGLPPSPDEVAEFQADQSPDAYERLVDRLLASPHFGERWARYWLDLARYVDFTPDWQKNTDQAWMYRDWIARAFNEDRPYDEFVRMQLAADLVADADPRDIAALGLLGVSPTYWKELKLAPSVIEVIVADEWDERLDTVSRTFLGLTVACARCHDHKFDPVTTRDYYALAGVFASTRVSDRPLLPSPLAEQVSAARKQLDQLQESLKKQQDKQSAEAQKIQQQIDELRMATPQIDMPLAPVIEDSSVYVVPDGPDATKLEYKPQPRDLPIFRRGNPSSPGEIIPRRYLELFSNAAIVSGQDSSVPSAASPTNLEAFRRGSGRLELANAIVTNSRSLTARVIVNRLWSYHFGKGLVRTPGDFGLQGERPTHPELLEWLASELAGDDAPPTKSRPWSLKYLHRLMVTSATYRQASFLESGVAANRTDPDNHRLSRMNRRRLDIEAWRDAMLVVAGNLDDRMEGAGLELDQRANRRRTIYGRIGRDEQNDMLRIHDFPPPTTHSPSRDITTTPLQQLFVFNSEFVEQQATQLAERLLEPADATVRQRIERCYQLLFQRPPRDHEWKLGERFLGDSSNAAARDLDRWRWYVQSLLGLNEFLFVD